MEKSFVNKWEELLPNNINKPDYLSEVKFTKIRKKFVDKGSYQQGFY